jgi:hypothetical protein
VITEKRKLPLDASTNSTYRQPLDWIGSNSVTTLQAPPWCGPPWVG